MTRSGEDTRTRHGPVWTVERVQALGLTTDVPTAAQILGIGRTLAFELLRRGRFPTRVLRIGRRVVVPVDDLLRLLTAPQPTPRNPSDASP